MSDERGAKHVVALAAYAKLIYVEHNSSDYHFLTNVMITPASH